MTEFKPNVTKSIDNLNDLQKTVDETIENLNEQITELSGQVEEMEKLQTKSITITENGTTEITPDQNYYALEKVNLTVNAGGEVDHFTKGDYLFYNTCRLSNLPNLAENHILDNITTALQMFYCATSGLTNPERISQLPLFDTSNIIDGTDMFYYFRWGEVLTSDKNVPAYNFSNITNAYRMFASSSSTPITSNKPTAINCVFGNNITNMYQMFYNQGNLLAFPNIPTTHSCTNFGSMCSGCSRVTDSTAISFDFSSVTAISSMSSMFSSCGSLSDASLKKIMTELLTVDSTLTGKTLSSLGFSSSQRTKMVAFDEWTALYNAGWTS